MYCEFNDYFSTCRPGEERFPAIAQGFGSKSPTVQEEVPKEKGGWVLVYLYENQFLPVTT